MEMRVPAWEAGHCGRFARLAVAIRGRGWGRRTRVRNADLRDFFGRRCAFVVTNAQRGGSMWRVRARCLTCESSAGSREVNVARNVACYIGFWSPMAVSRLPARVEVARDDVANVAHAIRPLLTVDRKRVSRPEPRVGLSHAACWPDVASDGRRRREHLDAAVALGQLKTRVMPLSSSEGQGSWRSEMQRIVARAEGRRDERGM